MALARAVQTMLSLLPSQDSVRRTACTCVKVATAQHRSTWAGSKWQSGGPAHLKLMQVAHPADACHTGRATHTCTCSERLTHMVACRRRTGRRRRTRRRQSGCGRRLRCRSRRRPRRSPPTRPTLMMMMMRTNAAQRGMAMGQVRRCPRCAQDWMWWYIETCVRLSWRVRRTWQTSLVGACVVSLVVPRSHNFTFHLQCGQPALVHACVVYFKQPAQLLTTATIPTRRFARACRRDVLQAAGAAARHPRRPRGAEPLPHPERPGGGGGARGAQGHQQVRVCRCRYYIYALLAVEQLLLCPGH